MARVTVEDCIDKVDNRFELVLLAGHRARMISSGSPITVDRDFDVHVAPHAAAALGIGELPRKLGHDGITVIIEPVEKRSNRRIFLIFDQGGVIESAKQISPRLKFFQQSLIVDIKS